MRIYKMILCCTLIAQCLTKPCAQTPTDALMMDKNQLCNAILYRNSRWSSYWEGALRRSNDNIGTNITQNLTYMANFGLGKNLNVMAALPYVWTKNTQGHLAGQRGIQDLAIWVKYRALQRRIGPGKFSAIGTLGAATPGSDYTPDLLPMSIGMGCSQMSLRGVLDYHADNGAYLTLQGGHIWRSEATLDRDAYLYDNKIYYTNKVPVPNMLDYSVTMGYRKGFWNFAATFSQTLCSSGDNIRRNDMPFVANDMDATAIGLMSRFHAKRLGFFTAVNQVVKGKNVGRATSFQGGVLYAIYVKKPAE
jgi:hypothetical protein